MSNGLLRAQFTFGSNSEVRYVAGLPAVGEYVTRARELWRVSSAQQDDFGLNVVCQLPEADEGDVERA